MTYASLPPPSPLALDRAPFPSAPPGLAIRFVLWMRHSLLRLADALSPSELVMFESTTGLAISIALAAVARFDLPDAIGDDALTAAELAARTKLDADMLHRTLRGLATRGVFAMDAEGRFRNTRLSRALRRGTLARTREWALYFTSGSNVAAWSDFARTLATGQSAFDRVHGMNVWDWFDAHRDEQALFANVMMGLTTADAPVIAGLYPFGEVKTICDVGGGRGTLLSELLLRHRHLRGVLCDNEGVLQSARELLTSRGVVERVELVAGSFFENVPAGADCYLMKNILHDWDDATCEKILRVVREAMGPGARLLICETIVDHLSRDPIGTLVDLHMSVACQNGRERSVADFEKLFTKCGLRLGRVLPFPTTSVLEALA